VAAAAIVIATIGIPLSKFWLSRETAVAQPVQSAAKTPAVVPAPEKPAVKPEAIAAAPAKEATPIARPTSAPVRNVTRPARPNGTLASQPTVAAPSLAIDAPSAAALPAPEPVAIEAPAPPPPAAPVGPFFESREVDRAPQVTSRIEPQVPESLQGQTLNEILIVRVLVSQAGQPALVSLLRRSKSGSLLDAAVIEAVKQWTFSPAIKRGQPVSCFLNVGVPVK
jgi:TonB family protein